MEDFSSSVEYVETDDLIFNRNYMGLLASLGFDDFNSVWRYQEGETVKSIKARSVIRIKLQVQNKERIFYLKRHNPEFIGIRGLLVFLFSKWVLPQGRKEFINICDFRKSNLATVIPVVAGEKRFRFFWVESFLITEDYSPFISMEDLFRDMPEFFTGAEGETRKKNLLNKIALFARKMHQSGFNHLDFNATHILLSYENGLNVPKLALLDLQRVVRRRFFKYRWMIKSLARLNYTLPDNIFNTEDRISILQFYKGKSKLYVFDRLQWLWIKRKTARIKRHDEKKMTRKANEKR
jgi:hypothetical protein